MSKNSTSQPAAGERPGQSSNRQPPKGADTLELLRKVDQVLREGDPNRALHLIARAKDTSAWAVNAQGVCHLRSGNTRIALDVFRSLVLAGGIHFRSDIPAVFKANFAVAMLLSDNIKSGSSILTGMRENDHPSVGKLKAAVRRWKQELPLWQRLNWYLGGEPNRPLRLDFPPGDLE